MQIESLRKVRASLQTRHTPIGKRCIDRKNERATNPLEKTSKDEEQQRRGETRKRRSEDKNNQSRQKNRPPADHIGKASKCEQYGSNDNQIPDNDPLGGPTYPRVKRVRNAWQANIDNGAIQCGHKGRCSCQGEHNPLVRLVLEFARMVRAKIGCVVNCAHRSCNSVCYSIHTDCFKFPICVTSLFFVHSILFSGLLRTWVLFCHNSKYLFFRFFTTSPLSKV